MNLYKVTVKGYVEYVKYIITEENLLTTPLGGLRGSLCRIIRDYLEVMDGEYHNCKDISLYLGDNVAKATAREGGIIIELLTSSVLLL